HASPDRGALERHRASSSRRLMSMSEKAKRGPCPPAARHDRAPGGRSQARGKDDDPWRGSEGRRSVENLALVEKKPGAASARTKTEADDGERSGPVGARDGQDGLSGSATLPVAAASATAPRIARR